MCPNVNRQHLICHCDRLLGHQLSILSTEKGNNHQYVCYFLFLLSICYVTTNSSRKTSWTVPSGGNERVVGISYNTDEASLACSSPPPVEVWFLIDQGLVLDLAHCAGIVDSYSKPSSGTFCKTKHPASSHFLNK